MSTAEERLINRVRLRGSFFADHHPRVFTTLSAYRRHIRRLQIGFRLVLDEPMQAPARRDP